MQRRIIFTRAGSNTVTGNFEPGTVARVSARLAAHLVEEVKVARYDDPPPPAMTREVASPVIGRTRTRRRAVEASKE